MHELEPNITRSEALDLTRVPDPSEWTAMPDEIRAMLKPPGTGDAA